jgi:hydrogenase maturation protease
VKNPLLIAGIGNIFFGDDAFGSEVARRMMMSAWPKGVRVEDFGIRSYDLAYALMEGGDAILVDVVSRGEPPGTLYLIELDLNNLDDMRSTIPDAHSMTPVSVLEMVKNMGGSTGRLYLLGCEPSTLESDEGDMGLSESVEEAVPRAIERLESLIADFLYDRIPLCPGLAGAAKEVT